MISENSLGLDHPDVARILNNIGSILRMKGEHEKVLEYYRKALAIRVKALGHDHPDVAQTLGNIGVVFSSNKEYEKALECFRRSLKIKEKVLGLENPQVAWSLNGIGSVLLHQGKPKEALGAFERLVHICEAKTCLRDEDFLALLVHWWQQVETTREPKNWQNKRAKYSAGHPSDSKKNSKRSTPGYGNMKKKN